MKFFQIFSVLIVSTLANTGQGSKTYDAIDLNNEDYQGGFPKEVHPDFFISRDFRALSGDLYSLGHQKR